MATVTEKDIISHLKEKIKFHLQEVKKIENVLSAFTGNPIVKDDQAGIQTNKLQRNGQSKANVALPKKRNRGNKSTNKPAEVLEMVVSTPVTKKNKPVAASVPAQVKGGKTAKPKSATFNTQAPQQEKVVEKKPRPKTASTLVSKNKSKQGPVANAKPDKGVQKSKAETKPETAAPSPAKKSLEIPAEYSDKMTINAKIAFALNEIGEGYNEDIANAMAQYEPQSDAKRLGKQISGILSTLKNKGFLTATREGRKDKYALIK